jgi:tetratricopeptide (TPR) repeat protein
MATYKKKGSSKKTKAEQQEQNSTTADVFNTLDEKAGKTEAFIGKYQNYIIGVIAVIAIGVLGYLGYNKFIVNPQQAEAVKKIDLPQQHFDQAVEAQSQKVKDSLFNLSLNGINNNLGLLDIAEEYSSTKTGNLAHYYAGMAYLNLSEWQKAIEHLDQFSSDDPILPALAKGAIGKAFLGLEQNKDALDYFEQASNVSDNEFTTPMFLFKAGITALEIGNSDKALQHFEQIKENYPDSQSAQNIDAFIGKAMAMK